MTKLAPHIIPEHFDANWIPRFRKWNNDTVKLVWSGSVPHLADFAWCNMVVYRDYPITENHGQRGFINGDHARAMGKQHASEYATIAREIEGFPVDKIVFESLNEPQDQPGGNEPPPLVNIYLGAFLEDMHRHGLRSALGNFGVGHPTNGGIKGYPTNWEAYTVFNKLLDGDYLAIHEYFPLEGVWDGALWWALSYLQIPYEVPILITECGIDHGVKTGVNLGWGGLSGSQAEKAERYVNYLTQYEGQLQFDDRVEAACIFTFDLQDHRWDSFNINDGDFEAAFFPTRDAPPPTPWGDQRTARWKWLVDKHSTAFALQPEVVGTVLAMESSGKPRDVSSKGAVGLMQVMPCERGLTARPRERALMNPDLNLLWGCRILRWELDAHQDSLPHALAAYYMGAGGLRDAGLNSQPAQHYLRTFVTNWQSLWHTDPPQSVVEALEEPGDHHPYMPSHDEIVNMAWNALCIPRNPESAFYKKAQALKLGKPCSAEFDAGPYRIQVFDRGILVAKIGEWNKMELVEWDLN